MGDYSVRTKDGLVQVVRSDGCKVGTVHQGPAGRRIWDRGGVLRTAGMDTAGGVG